MTWNHRVLKRVYSPGEKCEETHYQIYEVYYNEEGKPTSCTMEPDYPTGESINELREDLERMIKALEHPILNYEDF